MPTLPLNDGTTIPQLGFGTLNVSRDRTRSEKNTAATAEIVGSALGMGYRHIDTAQMYGNEAGVGRAVAASGIPREQLHVTSKLGNGNHDPGEVHRSFDRTLNELRLARLDLFLIHWPLPSLYNGDYVTTWRAVTDLVRDGRLRTAGVSNFQPAHLDRVIGETGIVPAVNQIEVHPYFRNDTARDASAAHGIAVEAWSPLGQGAVLDDPVLDRIALAQAKTPAQVVLRWHIQHGHVVFPKTTHRQRMAENLDVFGFALSAEEMAAIDGLDRGPAGRIGPDPDTFAWIP
ncbi:aldo/keto reductase [Amycolatopsis acidicola]|uniref:aldo/keto reductase n=1 Tax=Amycolatopsis acidicola TaxID=2596893 RepID=UPI001FB69BE4|nr:aldo/keto reductase [Amycolatopsis acidicola]